MRFIDQKAVILAKVVDLGAVRFRQFHEIAIS